MLGGEQKHGPQALLVAECSVDWVTLRHWSGKWQYVPAMQMLVNVLSSSCKNNM